MIIRQGAEQKYKPELYIETPKSTNLKAYTTTLEKTFALVEQKYPGITLEKLAGNSWQVVIPDSYRDGHEAHFAKVMEKYLHFLSDTKMPEWEVPNMLAKYYTTTEALKMAKSN